LYTPLRNICIINPFLNRLNFPGKHRKAPPRVKCIYPDKQTFAFRHDSPIWIEFDTPMNNASITKDTVMVRSSASDKPVEGLVDAGSKILMFRPYGEYPIGESGSEITITLLGNATQSEFITDENGIPLDGNNDEKPGGDFEYTYKIIK
jgi:hypothetical protein